METISIPKSDCQTFIAGQIGPELWDHSPHGSVYPKHGVIIWYEDKELVKKALEALFADDK